MAAVCITSFGVAAGVGLVRAHAQSAATQTAAPDQNAAHAVQGAAVTRAAPGEPEKPQVKAKTGDQQQREIASETADLLKMATALKTEVDKTTKDTLSVTVVRKANEIEQLAHKARTGTPKS